MAVEAGLRRQRMMKPGMNPKSTSNREGDGYGA
jgi:hypothetical protein